MNRFKNILSQSLSRWIIASLALIATLSSAIADDLSPQATLTKLNDIVIYRDEQFHCAFPSVVHRPDGGLLLAFRRAPDRRKFGETGYTHTDPNSYLVTLNSRDSGATWSKTPELLYANPFGGSQDPCMVQLSDNSILCASYGWAWMPTNEVASLKKPALVVGAPDKRFIALGGYVLRSQDGGKSWSQPIIPPAASGVEYLGPTGSPMPTFNRGAMCEGADGRLYWAVVANMYHSTNKTGLRMMISEDKGSTWKESCTIAQDTKIVFNETSTYETPKGDLVAFMRTDFFNDHLCLARSTDHGKTFQHWEDAGFQGHPAYALRLPDSRVLLVYGYRHKPYGVRARILNAECTDSATAQEVVLREDGGSVDLGYPWATVIDKDRVLMVYYFNQNDGTRYIAGTFCSYK